MRSSRPKKSREALLASREQFSREWVISHLDRFERLTDESGSGPAGLRASGVSERRLRNLYPFSVNAFTPSFEQLIEDPAAFKQLRRAMHPLRTRSENDLELAEQYHWSLYYRDSHTLRSFSFDLMLPLDVTAPLAHRVYELHGSDQFSLAKATLLSRTLHMIPTALNLAIEPPQVLVPAGKEKIPLSSISQRPYQHMYRSSFRFAEFHTVVEQLLSLLESRAAQPIVSLKAEM